MAEQTGELPGERARKGTVFRHRLYAIIWAGAFLSNVGNWTENSAQNWAVAASVARGPARGACKAPSHADHPPRAHGIRFPQ